ncbi:hypothetical protein VFPFJ_10640 [Purpureocillium lilacinum]|uniref:Uncharacterized protein n=1 Tax=Purpureocillium lilacinum TaxID=33203 RepID=A0A179GDH4_PURLI|nr:hypothetical protein VFPFJ_10640 [Purpureocillium lilacinum]OAQ75876.1 hypothetical protein VFPFJ_10640 [Purpureocillium lilacinum]
MTDPSPAKSQPPAATCPKLNLIGAGGGGGPLRPLLTSAAPAAGKAPPALLLSCGGEAGFGSYQTRDFLLARLELATGAEADISRPTRLEPPNDKAVTLPRLMVRMLMPSRSCDGNVTVIGLFARL